MAVSDLVLGQACSFSLAFCFHWVLGTYLLREWENFCDNPYLVFFLVVPELILLVLVSKWVPIHGSKVRLIKVLLIVLNTKLVFLIFKAQNKHKIRRRKTLPSINLLNFVYFVFWTTTLHLFANNNLGSLMSSMFGIEKILFPSLKAGYLNEWLRYVWSSDLFG